jgi:LAGLIDADG DNA endonuclease family protein
MGADNQQERLSGEEQKRWFLAGVIEGEGSMCISIKRHPTARFGFYVDPEFFIYQHRNRRQLLELAQTVFGTGRISPKSGNEAVLVFSIVSRRSISEKVIPFLGRYMEPFSARRDDIRRYREALTLFELGMHHTREGLERIVRLAYAMNHDGKQRQRPLAEVLDRILRGHTPDTPVPERDDMVRSPRRRGEPGGNETTWSPGEEPGGNSNA